MKSCWKYFFSDKNRQTISTLIMEIFLLIVLILILHSETLDSEDYDLSYVCLLISVLNFMILLLFLLFCFKQEEMCLFHRLTQSKSKHGFDTLNQIIFFIYHFFVFYFLIFWYVELIFTLIAFAFFAFEKADIIISIALVIFIYMYGVCETTNSQLRKCLRDFKIAIDDMVFKNRQEGTKDFTFLLECEGM